SREGGHDHGAWHLCGRLTSLSGRPRSTPFETRLPRQQQGSKPSMPRLELAKQLIEQVLGEEARAPTEPRPQAQPAAGRLLSVQQAGEYIGRSESAVRHLIFNRELPVVRAGRSVRLDRRDLDTWIENNKE